MNRTSHPRRERAINRSAIAFWQRNRVRWVLTAIGLMLTRNAGALELRDDAMRVISAWEKIGAQVETLPPSFLNDDATIRIPLPLRTDIGCSTVVILGARGLSFHAHLIRTPDEQNEDADSKVKAASVAGVLAFESCNEPLPMRVVVTSDAGRGAIEVLFGRSSGVLAPLAIILPERVGNVIAPQPEPGELPPLPPILRRAEIAELRAQRDGAVIAPRAMVLSDDSGAGDIDVWLDPGCHQFDVFGTDIRTRSNPSWKLDVDAELHSRDGAVLGRDRSDSSDAHLFACVGDATETQLIFVGSLPQNPVLVAHASWPLPAALPDLWGGTARAEMASALLVHHVKPPLERAVHLAQGPAGNVSFVVPVPPRSCFLGLLFVTHGNSRGLGLRAWLGAESFAEERSRGNEFSLTSFCSGVRNHVQFDVDARGGALNWGFALFQVNQTRAHRQ